MSVRALHHQRRPGSPMAAWRARHGWSGSIASNLRGAATTRSVARRDSARQKRLTASQGGEAGARQHDSAFGARLAISLAVGEGLVVRNKPPAAIKASMQLASVMGAMASKLRLSSHPPM